MTKDLNQASDADPYLRAMINDLKNSDNLHEITMPDPGEGNSNRTTGVAENESNGKGTGSTTYYNPYNQVRADGSKRPPVAGLVHELQHGWDKDKGVVNRSINGVTGNMVAEDRAMWTENRMRGALGLPLRPEY